MLEEDYYYYSQESREPLANNNSVHIVIIVLCEHFGMNRCIKAHEVVVAVRKVSLAALEAQEYHASTSIVMFLIWLLVSKELRSWLHYYYNMTLVVIVGQRQIHWNRV